MRLKANNSGSTLVEVLVSMVIFGLGVVGFVAMQLQSIEVVNDAYYRSQAIAVAQDVIERIKANSAGWPESYKSQQWSGLNAPVSKPCFNERLPLIASGKSKESLQESICASPDAIALYDQFEVSNFLMVALPEAKVSIRQNCSTGTGLACVEVSWGGGATDGACSRELKTIEQVEKHRCVTLSFMAYQRLF